TRSPRCAGGRRPIAEVIRRSEALAARDRGTFAKHGAPGSRRETRVVSRRRGAGVLDRRHGLSNIRAIDAGGFTRRSARRAHRMAAGRRIVAVGDRRARLLRASARSLSPSLTTLRRKVLYAV